MFNSAVLEVAIGIVFVFLLVSLLVSAFTELLSSWMRWRGTNLWKGLRGMLGENVQEQLYAHPLVRTLVTPHTKPPIGLQSLLALPGLRRLWPISKGPSYIPSRTFVYALLDLMERPYQTLDALNTSIEAALVDPARAAEVAKTVAALATSEPFATLITTQAAPLLAELNAPERERVQRALVQLRAHVIEWMKEPNLFHSELQTALRPILRATGNDVERFRSEIERWFDDMMDRVSGLYKRKTQAVQIAAALALAIALDIDTVLLARVFWNDSALRSTVVAEAEGYTRMPPTQAGDANAQFTALKSEITTLGLPIRGACRVTITPGPWWCSQLASTTSYVPLPLTAVRLPVPRDPVRWLGWLMTAIAVSFGAPFWFDVLKKFMTVRSAGRAPEETPTAPKAAPEPTRAA